MITRSQSRNRNRRGAGMDYEGFYQERLDGLGAARGAIACLPISRRDSRRRNPGCAGCRPPDHFRLGHMSHS